MPSEVLREPWAGFLRQVDEQLAGPTALHCLGGFVVAEHYGLTRATADVDFVEVRGAANAHQLLALAGKGSPLARKYRVHLDFVTIATVPDNYEGRLHEVFAKEFRHLQLLAFEPHDLALAKLLRNQDHDRADVKALAVMPGLDVDVLRQRYRDEMRWKLGNPTREDLTLDLWVEMIQEVRETP